MLVSDHNPRLIRDRVQIRLLSSPVRQEIVDTLAALGGEADVSSLAEHLGRPADGLYYHLRSLAQGGLIREIRRDGGRLFALVGEGKTPLRLVYDLSPDGNGAALKEFVKGLLHVAGRDFETAVESGSAVVAGTRRELWASRNKGWLAPQDIQEVNALLLRLSELTSQPRSAGRDRLVSVAFMMSPIDPKGKRRQGES
ncbi:helix-turn-helix domain-containing protein [Sphingomonas rosea]|uniref:helix-turn-helix domain-containing protein n=1 Tax=Sphingomonas rosea TaxID=335605 RepID=UPI0031D579FE